MREITRRLIAAFCLYTGIALFLHHNSGLFQIEPTDPVRESERRQQQAERITEMMAPLVEDGMPAAELFPAEDDASEEIQSAEADGRVIRVSGAAWEGLWNDIAGTVRGAAPSDAWEARRGLDYHEGTVFLPRDSGPLSQLEGRWPADYLQSYVRIEPVSSAAAARFLDVYIPDPSRIRDGAPTHIVYPYRTYGAALLLGGLLFYSLFPRRPAPQEGMFYLARAAGWLPDFLAAFGSGAFFAMPFLITADTESGSLDSGWWPLTVLMWGLAALFAVIFAVTAWYQTRRVTWDGESICIETWGRSAGRMPAAQIDSAGPYIQQAPRWLRVAAWLIAVLNPRAAMSAVLLDRSDAGFSLQLKDGRSYRFTGDGLWRADSFLRWLDQHGIPVAEPVRALMKTKSDYTSGRAGTVIAIVFALLVIGTAAPLLISAAVAAMPQSLPQFRDGEFRPLSAAENEVPSPSGEGAAPAGNRVPKAEPPDVIVTPEMLARETEILAQMREVRQELDQLRDQTGTVSQPNAEVIRKVEEAMQRLSDLQKEFDSIRSGAESPGESQASAGTLRPRTVNADRSAVLLIARA